MQNIFFKKYGEKLKHMFSIKKSTNLKMAFNSILRLLKINSKYINSM